jgi:uncharacterized phage-like protein YoqJ
MNPSPAYLDAAQRAIDHLASQSWPRKSSDDEKQHTWAVASLTGHRKLPDGQADFAKAEIRRIARKLRDEHATAVAISGLALGCDTWWANEALDAGLELHAYIPWSGQADRWSEEDRKTWAYLRSAARKERVFAETYNVRTLHVRNAAMTVAGDVIVVVTDGRVTGGTASTMDRARILGKPLIVVNVAERRTTLRLDSSTA